MPRWKRTGKQRHYPDLRPRELELLWFLYAGYTRYDYSEYKGVSRPVLAVYIYNLRKYGYEADKPTWKRIVPGKSRRQSVLDIYENKADVRSPNERIKSIAERLRIQPQSVRKHLRAIRQAGTYAHALAQWIDRKNDYPSPKNAYVRLWSEEEDAFILARKKQGIEVWVIHHQLLAAKLGPKRSYDAVSGRIFRLTSGRYLCDSKKFRLKRAALDKGFDLVVSHGLHPKDAAEEAGCSEKSLITKLKNEKHKAPEYWHPDKVEQRRSIAGYRAAVTRRKNRDETPDWFYEEMKQ
jgi:DNA-binding CsgD family transcriptional regulator